MHLLGQVWDTMAPVILSSWHLVGNTQDDSHADRGGREEKLVSGLLEMIRSYFSEKGRNA